MEKTNTILNAQAKHEIHVVYAKKEDCFGRIQLIHKTNDAGGSRFIRLDLTDIAVQEKVLHASNDDELSSLFTNYGCD